MMFGQLLANLKTSVSTPETKKLIQQCQQFNKLRIRMVHKLTGKRSLTDIKNQCKKAQKHFNIIYNNFDEINENYRLMFKDYKKEKKFYKGYVFVFIGVTFYTLAIAPMGKWQWWIDFCHAVIGKGM